MKNTIIINVSSSRFDELIEFKGFPLADLLAKLYPNDITNNTFLIFIVYKIVLVISDRLNKHERVVGLIKTELFVFLMLETILSVRWDAF